MLVLYSRGGTASTIEKKKEGKNGKWKREKGSGIGSKEEPKPLIKVLPRSQQAGNTPLPSLRRGYACNINDYNKR